MNKSPTNAARTLSPLLLILFLCAGPVIQSININVADNYLYLMMQ